MILLLLYNNVSVGKVEICVGNLHAFECNLDIIARVNGEVISRGEAESNLAISECNYIQNCMIKHVIPY